MQSNPLTQPLYGSTNPSAPPMTVPPSVQPAYYASALPMFTAKYEINPIWIQSLEKLRLFDHVLICDDSGSMREVADPDTANQMTRWDELKQFVSIVLECYEFMNLPCDIYFLNRGIVKNVRSWSQAAPYFVTPPGGGTNTVSVLQSIQRDRIYTDMGMPLLIHLFTDGHPTNASGQEDIRGFANWLATRPMMNRTRISIVLCTDDEAIEQMYRPLEYNPGRNRGIPGVDVSEDYRGETRDVRRARGQRYRFTFGDYICKTMIGAVDPAVHMIDLPQNPDCCLIL